MEKFDNFLGEFMTGDYFIIFLILILVVLLVLVLALVKTRTQYLEMLEKEEMMERKLAEQNHNIQAMVEEPKRETTVEVKPIVEIKEENDILNDFENLKATEKDDIIDENKPLIKQIDTENIKTYDDVIEEYENCEEEQAVISTEELEKRTKERMDSLGTTDNQIAIQKYEEEQEKKAIISYEQLVKNASNITLTYKEEPKLSKNREEPKVSKIEIKQKEITPVESYIKEDEFLKILKEFRLTLE